MAPSPTPYRILSLDGGGSWALIQVKCLQKLFGVDKCGHEILRHFELVAANSGGSLVLAALVANLPLPVILNLFVDRTSLPDIFAHSRSLWPLVHAVFGVGPQYSTAHKRAALEQHLVALEKAMMPPLPEGRIATLTLEEVPAYVGRDGANGPHLLITTYDYNRQRSAFFRSNPASYGDSAYLQQQLLPNAPPSRRSKAIRLLDAVHASSTAPVNFFDAPAEVLLDDQPNYLWDGGVAGYNNPVLAAVTEALTNNVAADRIRVLSIGTGAKVYPVLLPGRTSNPPDLVTKPIAHDWFTRDLRKLASAVVGAPPDAASFVAFTALNPGVVSRHLDDGALLNPNFIRANPSIQPELVGNAWQIPAKFEQHATPTERRATMTALRKLELDAVSPAEVDLVVKVCEAWLADELPNQPIRASNTLQCLIGQATFMEVANQFKKVFPIPTILTDLSRLPEIYALRVAAWEQSPGAAYVNHELFPQGWSDALDTHPTARHWVVEDEGRIVAAARVVLLDTIAESGQPDLDRFELPAGRPWGYWSRLVIAPVYRGRGLAEQFDQMCMAFLRESGAAFALGASFPGRVAQMHRQGWQELGPVVWRTADPMPPIPNHHLCLWQPAKPA